jgi:hypothetical protein
LWMLRLLDAGQFRWAFILMASGRPPDAYGNAMANRGHLDKLSLYQHGAPVGAIGPVQCIERCHGQVREGPFSMAWS